MTSFDEEPTFSSVADLLERLGPSILRPLTMSTRLLSKRVSGVTIYDSVAGADGHPTELLLAVGVDPGSHSLLPLMEQAANLGMTGVVVQTGKPIHPSAADVAQHLGVALLAASPTPWAHLAALLKSATYRSLVPATSSAQHPALGDLFAFASHVASELSGAVTIEDKNSQVLAYSRIHGDVDEPRKKTILGRAVPEPLITLLRAEGVFEKLRSAETIVHTNAFPELGLRRRTAIGIKASGEYLGSIWVAESGGALAKDHETKLVDLAKTAALHLLHHRLEMQSDHARIHDVARDLLAGGQPADQLATSAGLRLDASYSVAVFESESALPERQRLIRAVSSYWLSRGISAVTLEQGPSVYSILPGAAASKTSDILPLAARQVAITTGVELLTAVGATASNVSGIARSRGEADRALRVLRIGMGEGKFASHEAVRSAVTVLEIVDFFRSRPDLHDERLQRLLEADAKNVYLPTLKAYLHLFGDVSAAAAELYVHPNTFRYRLRRIEEIAGLNLADPYERLAISVQLHVLRVD